MTSRTPSRPLVVLLAVLLTVTACSADTEPAKAPAAAPAVLDGAFSLADHFNDAAVDAAPPGWTGTATVAAVPDAVDHSLRLTRESETVAQRASRDFPPATGVVEVQARVQARDWSAEYDAVEVAAASGAVAAGVGISRGRFVNRATGAGLAPADPGRWYALRLVLTTADQRYDLFVDGRQVLTRAPFGAAAADLARVSAGIRAGPAGTLYVDTVTARRTPAPSVDYVVFDQFNGDAPGARPAGHEVTGRKSAVTVAAVPSRDDRSLRLTSPDGRGEATSVRSFPAQTGVVVVQAALRTDDLDGTKVALYVEHARGGTAAALQFNGAWLAYYDGTTAHRLTEVSPREWYTVKLVLDLISHQFEVYIDGRRFSPAPSRAGVVDRRWPFRDRTLNEIDQLRFGVGAGQRGTVRVDNLMVFRPSATPRGTILNVRQQPYGAAGDGVRDDTAAVQKAIDAVPAGGTVFLGGGVFRTGTLRLRSDMTLWINFDAVLLGSTDDAAYPPLRPDGAPPVSGGLLTRGLVTSDGADRVRIEGGGTIDGNGRKPGWDIEGGTFRPALLLLTRGRDVAVRNIHVRNSATWAVVPDEIDGLLIADVTVDSRIYANRDGIDIVDSHGVVVERVAVSSDDDAICFKSYSAKGVDGAVVRLSTVGRSVRANGIKFGTGSVTAFRNVVVEDMLVKHVDKAALQAVAVDGSVVSNVTFRRITADGALRTIFVLLGRRTDASGPGGTPRWVSGLTFESVTGDRVAEPSALSGQRLDGVEYHLYHVLLSGVRQKVAGGVRRVPATPDGYTGSYPESSLWTGSTTPPAQGFYLRYVNGLTTRDTTVTAREQDVRPAVAFRDTTNVSQD